LLKAVLRNGVAVPIEPTPSDWVDGEALELAKAEDALIDIDAWAAAMNELCADSNPEDEKAMRQAIAEHRQQAKVQTRREMGLSE